MDVQDFFTKSAAMSILLLFLVTLVPWASSSLTTTTTTMRRFLRSFPDQQNYELNVVVENASDIATFG